MEMPIDEIIDRFTIFRLKKERIGGEEITKACKSYSDEIGDFALKYEIFDSKWIKNLHKINSKIWDLEADIRNATLNDLKEIGRRALLIRDANKERIRIKNEIIRITGIGFKDVKINHCSEEKNATNIQ